MKKVIITGVTGFIGSALAIRLLSEGIRVYGVGRNIVRLNELKRHGDFVPVQADFSKYDALEYFITDRCFDMFWHLAWEGVHIPYAQNNYQLQIDNILASSHTASLLKRLECKNACFITSVNEAASHKEYNLNPYYYSIAKRSAKEFFKAICLKQNILCHSVVIPNTYGEGCRNDTGVGFFVKQMLMHEDLNLVPGETLVDWIYIQDLINGMLLAASSGKAYEEYYIGSKEPSSIRSRLIEIKKILQSNSNLVFGAYPENRITNYDLLDKEALKRDTGFESMFTFEESIMKTAEWLQVDSR